MCCAGSDEWGLIAAGNIPSRTTLIENGPFDTSHAEVCDLLGVGKIRSRKPPHIYEFVQAEPGKKKHADDFGSTRNCHLTYCDLVKHRSSPSLFFYSTTAQKENVKGNVAFCSTLRKRVRVSALVAVADIVCGEQHL